MGKHALLEKFLENLAKMYTEHNFSYIEPFLDDTFNYSSMYVLAPAMEKAEYIDYITKKLDVMKESNTKFNFCTMFVQGNGEPHLVFTPKTPDNFFGCFVAKVSPNGKISELNLMSAGLYQHGYKDKNKFDEFMKKANDSNVK